MKSLDRSFALVLVLMLAPLVLNCQNAHQAPPGAEKPVRFIHEDFEDRVMAPWEGQFNEGNFSYSGDQPHSGDSSGKFTLGAGGDYWTSPHNGGQSARCEWQLFETAPVHRQLVYSWFVKIGADTVESGDWQVIGQFHDQPDPALGETWATYPAHSPPLSFKYKLGHFIVAVYDWNSGAVVDLASVALTKDQWHQVTARVYWSTGTDGTVECWLDGVPIQAPNGQTLYSGRNCFNAAGNYLKIGLYRSKDILTAATVSYDDVRIVRTLEELP